MEQNYPTVAARRHDPNYIQIFGDVNKELGLKFKVACTLNQITLGEGLEKAIALWLEAQEKASREDNQ